MSGYRVWVVDQGNWVVPLGIESAKIGLGMGLYSLHVEKGDDYANFCRISWN
ncbi:hypothetical protein SAMN03159475_0086 [Pseudomonas sp. NFPP33]|nr:hypothetical protein SAMN03159475_0086 [Pseudomonas sp. NFPP33]